MGRCFPIFCIRFWLILLYFIELDFYLMMNLISLLFIKSLKLLLCMKVKHYHTKPALEDVSLIKSKIYNFYHLYIIIIECWNWFLEFIHLFLIINYNITNSKVLLERPVLKNFKINICNNNDSWEFKYKSKIIKIISF